MGVGKTTVGRGLAARLGRPLRDSDDDLLAERGVRGRELAAREGVGALHRWEAEHLRRALAAPEPSVVTAAASVVDDPDARRALGPPFVAWLRAPASVLASRVRPSDHRRPLGPGAGASSYVGDAAALEEARRTHYAAVADVAVDAGGAPPDQVVLAVLDALPESVRG
jgi:shikimate kinase